MNKEEKINLLQNLLDLIKEAYFDTPELKPEYKEVFNAGVNLCIHLINGQITRLYMNKDENIKETAYEINNKRNMEQLRNKK